MEMLQRYQLAVCKAMKYLLESSDRNSNLSGTKFERNFRLFHPLHGAAGLHSNGGGHCSCATSIFADRKGCIVLERFNVAVASVSRSAYLCRIAARLVRVLGRALQTYSCALLLEAQGGGNVVSELFAFESG